MSETTSTAETTASETTAASETTSTAETAAKLVVIVRFEGEHAEFVKKAIAAEKLSNVAFFEQAVLNEAAEALGVDAPTRKPRAQIVFGEKGSRIPEAKALGLTTHEYRRRMKLLEPLKAVGIAVTPEMIKALPEKPKRERKSVAAAASE